MRLRMMSKFDKFCFFCLILFLNFNATTFAEPKSQNNVLTTLWGKPTPEPMLGLGMWSYHLKHESRGMDNAVNNLIGFSDYGYFVATLINSENRHSYAFGVQRYWLTKQLKPDLTYQLGYRLGLIYGYDDKLGRIAEVSPLVPFPQVIADFTWKHVGLELSYTWVVVSTSFYIRF